MSIPSWQNHVDISHLNTMAAPCAAEHYLEVTSQEALVAAVKAAQTKQLSIHLLGGGSNVLCPPFIHGLVLRPLIKGISVEVTPDAKQVLLTIGAGENWHQLVEWSLGQGYYGLENLALIPGSVGAAPIQNIGAYGVELSDCLHSVKWFDLHEHDFKTFSKDECDLGYRESIFKHQLKGRAVITAVVIQLNLAATPIIHYKPLAEYFEHSTIPVTPLAVFNAVCQQRNSKLPNPDDTPNSGSFFKNPVVSMRKLVALQKEFPSIPFYPQSGDSVKIPAAWLIDQCGLKGSCLQGLLVHGKQALVLTNPRKLTLKAILSASDEIANHIFQRFDIALEREPQVLGT